MSQNNQQRPTPETDALHLKQGLTHANYREFARKLERERDEAREELENILNVIPADAPCLHAETGETVADYILGMQKEVGRVHALYFNDKQQLEAMREAITEAHGALTKLINLGPLELPQHRDSALLVGSTALIKLQTLPQNERNPAITD